MSNDDYDIEVTDIGSVVSEVTAYGSAVSSVGGAFLEQVSDSAKLIAEHLGHRFDLINLVDATATDGLHGGLSVASGLASGLLIETSVSLLTFIPQAKLIGAGLGVVAGSATETTLHEWLQTTQPNPNSVNGFTYVPTDDKWYPEQSGGSIHGMDFNIFNPVTDADKLTQLNAVRQLRIENVFARDDNGNVFIMDRETGTTTMVADDNSRLDFTEYGIIKTDPDGLRQLITEIDSEYQAVWLDNEGKPIIDTISPIQLSEIEALIPKKTPLVSTDATLEVTDNPFNPIDPEDDGSGIFDNGLNIETTNFENADFDSINNEINLPGLVNNHEAAEVATTSRSHTVEVGDSLSQLAETYGTNVETLVILNNIENPDKILIGEILILPDTAQPTNNDNILVDEQNTGTPEHTTETVEQDTPIINPASAPNPALEQATIDTFQHSNETGGQDSFTNNNTRVASNGPTPGILPDNTPPAQWDGNPNTFDTADFDSIDNADGTQINWQEGSGAQWGQVSGQIITNLANLNNDLTDAENLVLTSLVQTITQNIGQEINGGFISHLDGTGSEEGFSDFGADLASIGVNVGIGIVAGEITAELLDDLDLNEFQSIIAGSLVNAGVVEGIEYGINTTVDYINGTSTSNIGGGFNLSSVGYAAAGQVLMNELEIAQTEEGQIGSAIGSAVGSIWGPPGAFIGSLAGGVIGDLLASDPPPPPPPPTGLFSLAFNGDEYEVSNFKVDPGSLLDFMWELENNLENTLNHYLDITGADITNPQALAPINIRFDGENLHLNEEIYRLVPDEEKIQAEIEVRLEAQMPGLLENIARDLAEADDANAEEQILHRALSQQRREIRAQIETEEAYQIPDSQTQINTLFFNTIDQQVNNWQFEGGDTWIKRALLNSDTDTLEELNNDISDAQLYSQYQQNPEAWQDLIAQNNAQPAAETTLESNTEEPLNADAEEKTDTIQNTETPLEEDKLNGIPRELINNIEQAINRIETSPLMQANENAQNNYLQTLMDEQGVNFNGYFLTDLTLEINQGELTLSVANNREQTTQLQVTDWQNHPNAQLNFPDGSRVNLHSLIEQYNVYNNAGPTNLAQAMALQIGNENTLLGTQGDDTQITHETQNNIIGSAGADTLIGTTKNDQIDYSQSEAGVNINLLQGQGIGGDAEGDALEGIEHLIGSQFNDTLIGNNENNQLTGLAGDDQISGGGGDDILLGGLGDDLLISGEGYNSLRGGLGHDTIQLQGENNQAIGSQGNDTLYGSQNNDVLSGGTGEDIIAGGSDADLILGNSGNDILQGGAGADLMDGGEGFDTALYTGEFNQYQFEVNDGLWVTDNEGDTDYLSGVERLQFADGVVNVEQLIRVLNPQNDPEEETSPYRGFVPGQAQIMAAAAAYGVVIAGTQATEIDEQGNLLISSSPLDDFVPELITATTSTEPQANTIIESTERIIGQPINPTSNLAGNLPIEPQASSTQTNSGTDSHLNNNPIYGVTGEATNTGEQSEPVIINTAEPIVGRPLPNEPEQPDSPEDIAFVEQDPVVITDSSTNNPLASNITPQIVAPSTLQINEDSIIELPISINLIGSGRVLNTRITLSGLPEGAQLSAGQNLGNGSWLLSTDELEGLTLTPAANSDENFSLNISVTIISEDRRELTTQQLINVDVNAQADTPALTAQAAFGDENSLIELDINSTFPDQDGSETVYIIIQNLPAGSLLSAGTLQADGSWRLQPEDLPGLMLTPPQYSDEDFKLTITAYSEETSNGDIASSTLELPVSIRGVADAPLLEVQAAAGNEDQAIGLSIQTRREDMDGSETAFVLITGVPAGAQLSAGVDQGNGLWRLANDELAGLTLTPAVHSDNDFILQVSAYSLETANGDIASSASFELPVSINALADTPELSVQTALGEEDSAIALSIDVSLLDTDGSENLTLVISGVPALAQLSSGVQQSDGSWLLTAAQLVDLSITPPPLSDENFVLTVTAYAEESSNGDSASSVLSLPVLVNAVAGTPLLSVQTAQGDEDSVIQLSISALSVEEDDSEELRVEIEGVPEGTTLSAGEQLNGIWILQPDELENLSLTPALNSDTDFSLRVTAYNVETENGHTASTSLELPIVLNAVADAPLLSVVDAQGDEDTVIELQINSQLVDTDGSETSYVVIRGMPAGSRLTMGDQQVDGSWRLTASQLEGLGLIPPQNSSIDFVLNITAYSQETANGELASTTLELPVQINALADAPVLSVQTARGDEDSAIALQIETAAFDADGSESQYLLIGNVPEGASLSAGVQQADGSWRLLPADLANLSITPSLNNSDDFNLSVTAFSVEEANGNVASSSLELTVQVNAVADAPLLQVAPASGDEDSPIALNISTALVDDDGSERIAYIRIQGVPTGAVLSTGELQLDGSWRLQPTELAGLSITPASNNSDDFSLNVTAFSEESENGDLASTSIALPVTVNAVADTPTLVAFAASGDEDTAIALQIETGLVDQDGSENVTVLIEDVPQGAVLSAGVQQADGSWRLQATDLTGLLITPPLNNSDDFNLRVTSYSIESENGNTASSTLSLPVSVQPIVDGPELIAYGAVGDEDTPIALNIEARPIDQDGSEILGDISISGVPEGVSLSAGLLQADGSWILLASELVGLTVSVPPNNSDDFNLTVTAFSTETETGSSVSSTLDLPVTVNAVADAPLLTAFEATGDEDSVIDLRIETALVDQDGSESLSHLIIDNVPQDAVLSAGVLQADGSWRLQPADLAGLTITPAANNADDFILNVTSYSVESENGHIAGTTLGLPVTVNALADAPELSATSAAGYENQYISLNISANFTDNDGSEDNYIIIYGVPVGSSFVSQSGFLSPETHIQTDGSWRIEQAEIEGLQIRPPRGSSSDFELNITAYSVEAENNSTASTELSQPLPVDVYAVAYTPSVFNPAGNVRPYGEIKTRINPTNFDDEIYGGGWTNITGGRGNDILYGDAFPANELVRVRMSLRPLISDNDGSETWFVTVYDVPANAYFYYGDLLPVGPNVRPGTWVVDAADLDRGNGYAWLMMPMVDNPLLGAEMTLSTSVTVVDIDPDTGISSTNTPFPTTFTTLIPDPNDFAQADTLDGGEGADSLYGGGGGDTLTGGAGADRLYGQDGDDFLNFDAADTVVSGGSGYDIARAQGNSAITVGTVFTGVEQIIGGSGYDILALSGNNDVEIQGGAGYDVLRSGSGADTLIGGSGIDIFDAGGGNDVIVADSTDFLFGYGGVNGGTGNDTLNISDNGNIFTNLEEMGIENINSGGGDDVILAGAARNNIDGGVGIDIVSYENSSSRVVVRLNPNSSSGGGYANGDSFSNVEGVIGSRYSDYLYGSYTDNILEGAGGNDRLDGGGGYNIARFEGAHSDYLVEIDRGTVNGRHNARVTQRDGGVNGTDSLTGIDEIQFYNPDNPDDYYSVYLDGTNNAPYLINQEIYNIVLDEDYSAYYNRTNSSLLSLFADYEGDALYLEDMNIAATAPAHIDSDANQIRLHTNWNQFHNEGEYSTGSFTVSDGKGGVASSGYNLHINPVNDSPEIPADGISLNYNWISSYDADLDVTEYSISITNGRMTLTDVDSSNFSFSIVEHDFTNASMNSTTGQFSFSRDFTAGADQAYFVIQGTDDGRAWIRARLDTSYTYTGTDSFSFTRGSTQLPIAIDLDNDGLEYISMSNSSVWLDGNNDGIADRTSWVAADDGLLYFDQNKDGTVNGFSELNLSQFHTDAVTDLEGLALYFDDNQDGVFDVNDSLWNQFGIWQDLNQNGISEENEMFAMDELGVRSIHLQSDNVERYEGDVHVFGEGQVEFENGDLATFADIGLLYETESSIDNSVDTQLAADLALLNQSRTAETQLIDGLLVSVDAENSATENTTAIEQDPVRQVINELAQVSAMMPVEENADVAVADVVLANLQIDENVFDEVM